jgi:hypothetical protein
MLNGDKSSALDHDATDGNTLFNAPFNVGRKSRLYLLTVCRRGITALVDR